MRRLIPGNPVIAHLVETNSKIGVFYGNKFLPVAVMLQCSSRRAGKSLENESPGLKTPAIDPELTVALPATPRPADASLLI